MKPTTPPTSSSPTIKSKNSSPKNLKSPKNENPETQNHELTSKKLKSSKKLKTSNQSPASTSEITYTKPPSAKEVYTDDLELRICKLLIAKDELRQKQEKVSNHIIMNTSYYRETGVIWLKLARRNNRKAKFRIIQLIALVLRKLSEKKNLKSLVEVYCHLRPWFWKIQKIIAKKKLFENYFKNYFS